MHATLQLRVQHPKGRRIELKYGKADGDKRHDFLHQPCVFHGVRLFIELLENRIRGFRIMFIHT